MLPMLRRSKFLQLERSVQFKFHYKMYDMLESQQQQVPLQSLCQVCGVVI